MKMRKNAVIKGVEEILGGVCAPRGFTACGSERETDGWEYALVKSEARLPAAFACNENGFKSSSLEFAEKRFNGILRVFAVLSGVADAGQGKSAEIAKELSVVGGRVLGVPDQDVLPLIVGDVSKRLPPPNVKELLFKAKPLNDNSAAAARAICGQGVSKEGAFSFYIGDVRCKIGYIGRGKTFTESDCALVLLTTDTDISAPLLQKALEAEMKDSFGMLCSSDLPSPTDAVCVMASGQAGNYPITEADTDYKKFADGFHLACIEICKTLMRKTLEDKLFLCTVKGVRSKQSAREIAKLLASSETVKLSVRKGFFSAGSALSAIGKAIEDCQPEKIDAFLSSNRGKLQVISEGKTVAVSVKKFRSLLADSEITLTVEIKSGNYSATALSTLE